MNTRKREIKNAQDILYFQVAGQIIFRRKEEKKEKEFPKKFGDCQDLNREPPERKTTRTCRSLPLLLHSFNSTCHF